MSTKLKAIVSGWAFAITSFISWLATVPPEQQSGMLAQFVEIVPVSWRPAVGLIAKAIASFSSIYGLYQASHSGPQTPPKNPPQ